MEKLQKEAEELLPFAISYARNYKADPDIARDLMNQAVMNILSSGKDSLNEIKNLRSYLFATFRYLLFSDNKSRLNKLSLNDLDESRETSLYLPEQDYVRKIEREILLSEITRLMNKEERFIYDLLVIGYSYAEIVPRFRKRFDKNFRENVLRSKFSKTLQKITKILHEQS